MNVLDQVVAENYDYVRMIAGKVYSSLSTFIKRSVDYEDLVQQGLIGVCTAHGKYKGNNGAAFRTYAFYWVRKLMYDYIHYTDPTPRYFVKTHPELEDSLRTVELQGDELSINCVESEVYAIEINEFINSLPDVKKTRFIDHVLGHKGIDIAAQEGVVKSTICESLKSTRNEIKQYVTG